MSRDATGPLAGKNIATLTNVELVTEVSRLFTEIDRLQGKNAALKLEAQCHAMEARTANSTIYEIYQIITGAKGEPGNWRGAEPVRKFVVQMQAALLPFSKAAEIKLCGEWRDDERFAQTDVGFHLTFGDLRRARTALSSKVQDMAADPLDWSGFKGVQINKDWTPDDQELIYTALGVYDGDGDMDDDAREQIIERLLAAWQRSTSPASKHGEKT